MVEKIVSASWLQKYLFDEDLIIVNASPSFDQKHTIQGARHFDIKNVFSDTSSTFPNTFPSASQFESEARKIGIDQNSHIVVYEDLGIFYSPRVWWMFTVMGHKKISVLNGGLPDWKASGFSLSNGINTLYETGDFNAVFDPAAIKKYDDILKNTISDECYLIDARSKGRFTGEVPEPRSHIQSGHIKNAINLPYTAVLDKGKYRSKEQITSIFKDLNITDKPVIFTCGSGITACIIFLALELISNQTKYIYDGSWTEWAEKEGLFT